MSQAARRLQKEFSLKRGKTIRRLVATKARPLPSYGYANVVIRIDWVSFRKTFRERNISSLIHPNTIGTHAQGAAIPLAQAVRHTDESNRGGSRAALPRRHGFCQ